MRIRKLLVLLTVSMLCHGATSQTPTQDSVFLNRSSNNSVFIKHELKKGQTLYQLSKTYGAPIEHILHANPFMELDNLSQGTAIEIPIELTAISSEEEENRIPAYYQVKAKETLYSISKVYFQKTIDEISKLNGLSTSQLGLGQILLIGWLSNTLQDDDLDVHLSQEVDQADVSVEEAENEGLTPIEVYKASDYQIIQKSVVAFWNVNRTVTRNYYVMHKDAKVNSIMEVYNPMMKRTIFAKVIGNIPEKAYPGDIELIVSPGLANALGILDPRFYAQIKYIE